MSLDIGIRAPREIQRSAPEISLEDDGYYWFPHPWLECLREQSGKYVDLYGDAVFTADDFPRLRRLLDEALTAARRQPAQWRVCIGVRSHPVDGAVHKSVQRDRVLALLGDLRTMVDVAETSGGMIECVGD